jgi:tetratricopeptide (TPR) repeat protein
MASRSSIATVVHGQLADHLASCRELLRGAENALLARSRVGEAVDIPVVPLEVYVNGLEDKVKDLQERLEVVQDEASGQSIKLHLGVVHAVLGRLKEAVGTDVSAAEHARRALESFDEVSPIVLMNDDQAALYYVRSLVENQRISQAIQFLADAASFGKLPLSLYLGVAQMLDVPESENKVKVLRAAFARAVRDPAELSMLADALEWAGQKEMAVEALREASGFYAKRGNWVKALEACEHQLAIHPGSIEERAMRACLLVEMGRLSEAIPELREMVGIVREPDVRLSLSKALILEDQPEMALPLIDEVLREYPQDRAVLCLWAEACNRMEHWDEALEHAEAALEQRTNLDSEAKLQKGIALYGMEKWESALNAMEEVLKENSEDMLASLYRLDIYLRIPSDMGSTEGEALTAAATQVYQSVTKLNELGPRLILGIKPLLHVLRKLERWDEAVRILDQLLEASPTSTKLILEKCSALRSLGRQDEALQLLASVTPSAERKYIRLKAALLCDAGDFGRALELLMPLTPLSEPIPTDLIPLLSLRAWADQNCIGDNRAVDGENVYRRLVANNPQDRWSRKGLGNALLRLGRKEQAFTEYQKVIDFAEEMRSQRKIDPYDSVLAGWCYYCVGRFEKAAELYESGLAVVEIGLAAQFDYALILLANSSYAAARLHYQKSIVDTNSKNIVRRCGLFYVALFDLCRAFEIHPAIGQAEESYVVRRSLRDALRESISELPTEWKMLATHIGSYLDADEREAEALAQQRVVLPLTLGFIVEEENLPCATFEPTLGPKNEQGTFYPLPQTMAESVSGNSALRILWIGKPMLDAMGLKKPSELADQLHWEEMETPVCSWAAVTTRESAEAIRDKGAKRLLDRSVMLLTEHFANDDKQKLFDAAKIVDCALRASCNETILYQAIVAYGAAGGDVSANGIRRLQCGVPEGLLANPERLKEHIQEVRKLIEMRGCQELAGQRELRGADATGSPKNLVEYVLAQVRRIAQISDLDEQDRSAAQASADMWLLLPLTEELEGHRQRLKKKLNENVTFYLDDDQSLLVMSREPAFYSSSVLRSLGERRGIDSLRFFSAAKRMKHTLPWLIQSLDRERSLQIGTR